MSLIQLTVTGLPVLARRDTVALWRKVHTVSDPEWTRAFTDPAPLDKAHGARVVVTYDDGTTLEDELRVANAHPRGQRPWRVEDYRRKFRRLADRVAETEAERFLDLVQGLPLSSSSVPYKPMNLMSSACSALPWKRAAWESHC